MEVNEQERDKKDFAVSLSRSNVSQDYSFPCTEGTEYLMAKEVGGTCPELKNVTNNHSDTYENTLGAGGAKSGALAGNEGAELAEVIERWRMLKPTVRKVVLAIVRGEKLKRSEQ